MTYRIFSPKRRLSIVVRSIALDIYLPPSISAQLPDSGSGARASSYKCRGWALADSLADPAPLDDGCLCRSILFSRILLLTVFPTQDWICEVVHPL